MIYLIISIFALLCAFLAEWLGGRFSAMQDAVKHFPLTSIFNKQNLWGTTKKILKYNTGILYEYWYNLNGKDHLAKYENYDNTQPKRKFKILGLKIHIVQLCDGWHWWKMWKVGMYNLSDVFASIATLFSYIFLRQHLTVDIKDAIIVILALLFIYYWSNGYFWNLSFNYYYDKKLRKA